MKICVSSVEYQKWRKQTLVHIFGINEKREFDHRIVYGVYPEFFVKKSVTIPTNPNIYRVSEGWKNLSGEECVQVEMFHPEDVGGRRIGDKIISAGFRDRFAVTYQSGIEFRIVSSIKLGIKGAVEVPNNRTELYFGVDKIEPIDFNIELSRMHIDIETQYEGGEIANWRRPYKQIYSISTYFNYDNRFVCFVQRPDLNNKYRIVNDFVTPIDTRMFPTFPASYKRSIWTFDNEIDMLATFIEYFREKHPCISTGWFFKNFDMPYLVARMNALRQDDRPDSKLLSPMNMVQLQTDGFVRAKGLIVFDTLAGFRKVNTKELDSNGLDDVAMNLFNVGKVHHSGIDVMYKEDIDKLLNYNAQDVFLEMAIGIINKIFQFFQDIKAFSGCHYEDVLNNNRIIDALFLHDARARWIVLPNTDELAYHIKFKGAIVFLEAEPGFYYSVLILDLKSTYPFCMITLNIGEDTVVRDPTPEQAVNLIKSPLKGIYFRKDMVSFVASILLRLIKYRDELKELVRKFTREGDSEKANAYNRIQTVVKFITNTIYGVLGWVRFRLYNRQFASIVTATARMVILFTIKILMKMATIYMINLFYGDTDSVFNELKTLDRTEMEVKSKKIVAKINESYSAFNRIFNVDHHSFLLLPEKIYSIMLMCPKKTKNKSKNNEGDTVAKKRYGAFQVAEFDPITEKWNWLEKPKMEIKGFDRSDMSKVGKRVLKKLIEMALRFGLKEIEKGEIISYLSDEIKKIRDKQYDVADISFPKGISKQIREYDGFKKDGSKKTKPNWVRAAEWTNRYSSLWGVQTNYGRNSKPKFLFIQKNKVPPPYDKTDLVALNGDGEVPDEIKDIIDYDAVIENTIRAKVETVLSVIEIDWNIHFGNMKVSKGVFNRGVSNVVKVDS